MGYIDRDFIEFYVFDDYRLFKGFNPDLVLLCVDLSNPETLMVQISEFVGYILYLREYNRHSDSKKTDFAILGCKSDCLADLERDHGEEVSEYVVQILRWICLKLDLSPLIFCSIAHENTIARLKSFIWTKLIQSDVMGENDALVHNIAESHAIYVPTNWDTVGKINIIRKFDEKLHEFNADEAESWKQLKSAYEKVLPSTGFKNTAVSLITMNNTNSFKFQL